MIERKYLFIQDNLEITDREHVSKNISQTKFSESSFSLTSTVTFNLKRCYGVEESFEYSGTNRCENSWWLKLAAKMWSIFPSCGERYEALSFRNLYVPFI